MAVSIGLLEVSILMFGLLYLYYLGLDARKPVSGVLRTTKAQTCLRIRAVLSASLLFAYGKDSYLDCYDRNFNILAILCGRGHCFESHFVGNPEDRFSRDEAHLTSNFDLVCDRLHG